MNGFVPLYHKAGHRKRERIRSPVQAPPAHTAVDRYGILDVVERGAVVSPRPGRDQNVFPALHLGQTGKAEPCLPGVTGLTAQDPATVQLCAVQLAQQGAVHREPLRVAVGGRNGIPLRGKQLAEGLVLQGCFRQPGHVPHGGNMFRVVQTGGVAEMRAGHPQLCRFLVHPGHKGFLAAAHLPGQRLAALGPRGQHGPVQQIPHRGRFPGPKSRQRGILGLQSRKDLLGQGHGRVEVRVCFYGQQRRHHLGHGSRIDRAVGILFGQHLPAVGLQ